jgi:AbrB family looped-hinge helix DNA binding protein
MYHPLATTRMSTRGQVVIPMKVRRHLGIPPGTEFVVVGHYDVVVLKKVTPPQAGEFGELLALSRQYVRRAYRSAGFRALRAAYRRGEL